MRSLPNILVTGTPGVGKTSLCQDLQEALSGLDVNSPVLPSTGVVLDGLGRALDLSEQRCVNWSRRQDLSDEREFSTLSFTTFTGLGLSGRQGCLEIVDCV